MATPEMLLQEKETLKVSALPTEVKFRNPGLTPGSIFCNSMQLSHKVVSSELRHVKQSVNLRRALDGWQPNGKLTFCVASEKLKQQYV